MDDRSKEMVWVFIACGLRLVLQEIIQDIKDNKLIVKPSSALNQYQLQTRIRQLDNLMWKLVPNPDGKNQFAGVDIETALKEKKGKKLN